MTLPAKIPGTHWRGPVPNMTPGGLVLPLMGLVLHVEEGTETGADAWFHDPTSQVSAHFGAPAAGGIDQWVAATDRAWAEVAGNSRWLSVETEGENTTPLTDAQMRSIAELYATLRKLGGPDQFPWRTSNSPTEGGFGWHGMGGVAWGDHPDCPGDPRKEQRRKILAAAIKKHHPKPAATPHHSRFPITPPFPGTLAPGSSGTGVEEASSHLRARGWTILPTDLFDAEMETVVLDFQAEKGLRVDGIIGPVTWWAIWHAPVTT